MGWGASTASWEFCPTATKIEDKYLANIEKLQPAYRFIPNSNPTQMEEIFFSSLQLSNCSGFSPVVIQMITGWGSGGHPCDSDNRSLFRVQGLPRLSPPESAKEFPLCLNGRADRQHHPIPHETHSISGSHTRRLKRHVDPMHMRRGAMPVKSPAPLRQIWGIGECPALVFMRPKHPRGIHDPNTANSGLDHSWMTWLGGGARWRKSVELRNGWHHGEQTVAEVGWAIPRLTCYNGPHPLTHPDSLEWTCESIAN